MKRRLKAALECLLAVPFFFIFPLCAVLGRWSTERRRASGLLPRLIWGATPILTIAVASEAMRRLGYDSTEIVFRPYHIYSRFRVNLERWARFVPVRLVLPFAAFLYALLRFDVFHGFYDGGLLAGTVLAPIEWRLLRWSGKLSLVFAYGSDVRTEARTRALGSFNCCTDCDKRVYYCACRDEVGGARVQRALRDATLCLSMGDMIEYTHGSGNSGSRDDLFYWPIDLAAWPEVGVRDHDAARDGPVRVVHATNHRMFKGTRFLVDAVAALRAEGFAIELDIVEGVSNDEVRRRTEAADIVAEQFLIGYFGYFAVEAMALGKPVITFVRKAAYLPMGETPPFASADPTTLAAELRRLVEDAGSRRALGRAGRRFVERVFSLEAYGRRMDELYRALWFPRAVPSIAPAAGPVRASGAGIRAPAVLAWRDR